MVHASGDALYMCATKTELPIAEKSMHIATGEKLQLKSTGERLVRIFHVHVVQA